MNEKRHAATPHRLTKEQIEAWRDWWHEPHLHTRPEGEEFAVLCDMALSARSETAHQEPCPDGDACPDARRYGSVHPAPQSASREPKPYDVMADAVCEIADAARQAFVKAGFDPGEWDSDNIVQDVKNGLVSAIETLAARSAIAPQEWIDIKDRLPEEFTEVLLMHLIDDHAKTIDIAWQSKGEWSFPWLSRLRKVDCAPVWPLRWMPLPAVDRTGA